MLYKEWLNEWLELYVKAATKEKTYRKYRQQAEKYILPALGNYDVNVLSAVELQKFSVSLSEYGLAPNSINFIIAVLRSSLKKGVQLGIIDRQYGDAIVRPRVRANAVSCFTTEEQKKIENYILGHEKPYLFGGYYFGFLPFFASSARIKASSFFKYSFSISSHSFRSFNLLFSAIKSSSIGFADGSFLALPVLFLLLRFSISPASPSDKYMRSQSLTRFIYLLVSRLVVVCQYFRTVSFLLNLFFSLSIITLILNSGEYFLPCSFLFSIFITLLNFV